MKQKRFFIGLLLSLILLLLFSIGCQTTVQEPKKAVQTQTTVPAKENFTLTIVETTDVHGLLFPWNFKTDKPTNTSLAQIYTYVKEMRNSGKEVMLLDDGDILQGQPVVYYYNFVKTDVPHVTTDVMNYMGYDAATLGNHDIEAGHPVYDKLSKEFKFPWLGANAIDEKTGKPYFPPYAVFNKNGAKIVVFGLITPGISSWLPEDIWKGIDFQDMVETAKKWVPVIEEKEKPDLLIGLFHSGTDFTYSGYAADSPLNPNAAQLVAEEVPGFDIVFAGHDHAGRNEVIKNADGKEVLILGALNNARTAAVAKVNFTYDEVSGNYTTAATGEIIDAKDFAPDPDFMNEFQSVVTEVKSWVSKPIGEFTATIATRPSMFGDSAFVDLIHRIQLELTDADVSFAAPLSFDAQIAEGQIYVRDMFSLYQYENLLYTMNMTGKEIKDFLEYSYDGWFSTMTGPDDHLINFKKDKDGKLIWNDRYSSYDTFTRYYNYDSAAGVNYTVDVSKPAGSRVSISAFADGRPFVLDKTYKIAINSYRGTGGGGHLTKGAGIAKSELASRTISSTIQDLRYYLMTWIINEGTVTPKPLENWKVLPEVWWQKAKEKDYAILYEGAKE